MHREKRVLVSWYTDPRYIPPFVLTDRQVTVGQKINPDQDLAPFDGFTPYGRYDLFAALEALNLPTEYDAIVVWSDAHGANQPVNLEAFSCPKVLCVGDTHHLENPLRTMIDYAKDARYDFVLSSHNRHHLHWFVESGLKNVAWLPGIKVRNLSPPFTPDRKAELCFFGSAGKRHPRRQNLLSELSRRKPFPFTAMYGRRELAADRFATSAVSLNCSLNGDLNLRVFEILAATGCLLTDRLSPQSGMSLLLEEGKEFVGYDDVGECIEQAHFLLADPQAALEIAQAGRRAFTARMTPEQRIRELFDWVFTGQLDSLFRAPDVPRDDQRTGTGLPERIRVYETLQEIHKMPASPSVLFMGDVPDIHIHDALDLRHLKMSIGTDPSVPERARPPEIAKRCTVFPLSQLGAISWDCIVTKDGHIPSTIRYRQAINASAPAVVGQPPRT